MRDNVFNTMVLGLIAALSIASAAVVMQAELSIDRQSGPYAASAPAGPTAAAVVNIDAVAATDLQPAGWRPRYL